jgi:hypothetical protein
VKDGQLNESRGCAGGAGSTKADPGSLKGCDLKICKAWWMERGDKGEDEGMEAAGRVGSGGGQGGGFVMPWEGEGG